MKRLLYLLFVVLIAACKSRSPETPAEKAPTAETDIISLSKIEMDNASIKVGKVTTQTIDETLKVNGVIDVPPQNLVSVSFPMAAFLRSTELLPGMQVRKGQVVATMEDQSLIQLQQDYLVAKSKLEFLEKDYERQKLLNESKASSDKVLQQSKADYEMQRVLLRGFAEKLRLIHIDPTSLNENNLSRRVNLYAPVNGFVSKVNVNMGRYIQPTEVMFELTNPDDLHVALTVFEKDINKIQPGQKVYINFVDEPEKKYEASVFLVTKDVNESRAGNVHCHFERLPSRLRPGMFVNAIIHLDNRQTRAVPESAVVRFENRHFVFVQHGQGRFQLTEVNEGASFNNFIELINPTAEIMDSTIIIENAYAALMKLKNVPEE